VIAGKALLARFTVALTATVTLALAAAPSALADTSQSSNWAGYAAHHTGVNFSKVVGEWVQPTAACTAGQPTYSSVWVGLGGYSLSSKALEQIGTELDCSRSGHAVSSAWYELVPAASHTIRLAVAPGDRVRATVAVSGHQVQLTLADLTRHRSFTKSVRASVLDTTSADWIVEAPAVCVNQDSCQTLPLADFGSASFSLASAESTTGHTGTISDRSWSVSQIRLAETGHRFVTRAGPSSASASATPTSLSANGSSFTVTYSGLPGATAPASASRVTAVRAGQLVRPARSAGS
jgi:Peptidase A4 family